MDVSIEKYKTRLKMLVAWMGEVYKTLALTILGAMLTAQIVENSLESLRTFNRNQRESKFVDENWKALTLAYPTLSKTEVLALVSEARSNVVELIYAPWIQFTVPPITSRYVNSDGSRRSDGSTQDWKTAKPDAKHFDVYFFGGSTMFGFGVPDGDTLPAQFQKLAKGSQNVRAYNYGVPSFYSLQEGVQFELMLRAGERPSAAVFMDGLNDVLQPSAVYSQEPFFTPLLRRRMAKSLDVQSFLLDTNIMRAMHTIGLAPSKASITHGNYAMPHGVPMESVADSIYEKYLSNIKYTQKICQLYAIKCYFVWQPSPMHRYNNPVDTLSRQETTDIAKKVYEKIDEMKQKPKNFLNYSDALEKYNGQPFVDEFHYSAPFIEVMAKRLLKCVVPDNPNNKDCR